MSRKINTNNVNVLAINNIGLIYRKLKNYEKAIFTLIDVDIRKTMKHTLIGQL